MAESLGERKPQPGSLVHQHERLVQGELVFSSQMMYHALEHPGQELTDGRSERSTELNGRHREIKTLIERASEPRCRSADAIADYALVRAKAICHLVEVARTVQLDGHLRVLEGNAAIPEKQVVESQRAVTAEPANSQV